MRASFILLTLVLVIAAFTAVAEETIPALESGLEILETSVSDDACAVLLGKDDKYQIALYVEMDGAWTLVDATPLLEPRNGRTPWIELNEYGNLYIHYYEWEYIVYTRIQRCCWRLDTYYHSDYQAPDFFVSFYNNGIFVAVWEEAAYWVFGELRAFRNLRGIDLAYFVEDLEDITHMVNSNEWGSVNHLAGMWGASVRQQPDPEAVEAGTLFSGAPVRILQNQREWCFIEIAGLQGWLPTETISRGADMTSVDDAHIRQLTISDAGRAGGALYSTPDTASEILCCLNEASHVSDFFVIGKINDDWYLIWNPDGIGGFVQAYCVTPGNG